MHVPQTQPGRRARTIVIVLALVALPSIYVGANWPAHAVQAIAMQASPQPSTGSLSQLEEQARTQPTAANRIGLSLAYIQGKMYGSAIDVLMPLVAEFPGNAAAWNNLCVARTLQLEYNLAIDACNSGLRADGSFQLLRNNLRWAQGERDKTIAALAEQEKTGPAKRDTAFYLAEGLNQLHLGDYGQAITAWQRALQADPKNPVLWNNIGTAKMMQHHYDEARSSFLRASALAPDNQLMRNNLAWADGALKPAR